MAKSLREEFMISRVVGVSHHFYPLEDPTIGSKNFALLEFLIFFKKNNLKFCCIYGDKDYSKANTLNLYGSCAF